MIVLTVAAALLLLAGVAILLRPSAGPVGGGTPRLEADRTEIDLGRLPFGRWATATFRIRNAGDGQLVISNTPRADAVLGCWPPPVVVGQMTLKPGESTEVSLRFTMHSGMGGPHDFRVPLRTNDPGKPEQELAVRSHWGPWRPIIARHHKA